MRLFFSAVIILSAVSGYSHDSYDRTDLVVGALLAFFMTWLVGYKLPKEDK